MTFAVFPGPGPGGGGAGPGRGSGPVGLGPWGPLGPPPTARQTAGPGRHRNQAPGLSLFCCIMGVSGNPQIEGVSAGEHAAALRGTRTDERATVLRPQSATQTPLVPRKIPDPTEMWF